MSAAAFDFCLALAAAHSRLQRKLDDELGTFHGLGLADFRLLTALAHAPGQRLATGQLGTVLGVQPSAAMRHVLPLEKSGWVAREASGATRSVALRAPGERLQREAAQTVAAICGDAMGKLEPDGAVQAGRLLAALADSPVLELR
jgi:DNA-binding MarR family transcriptional regulator